MNKNIIIVLLLIVIALGVGYYLTKGYYPIANNTVVTNAVQDTTKDAPTPQNPNTVDTTPSLTLGTPKVATNPNSTVSISTALLNGQVTPSGVQTIYWFEYGEATGLLSKSSAQVIGSGFYPIAAPQYIAGLRANTVYSFRLAANNNFGTVYGDTYTFKTNNNPPPKAATPTVRTNSATNVARTDATINGQVTPNGWQTNYWFEYGKDNKFGITSSIKSINENTSLTSTLSIALPISSLSPSTKYYFRLNAQNQFGTINGSTLNFTTKGPR